MTFKELCEQLAIPLAPDNHEHVRRGWQNLDCPWCCPPNSGRWRLGFNLAFQYVNCWSCGAHNVYTTLKEITGKPEHELRKLLSVIERDGAFEKPQASGKLELPDGIGPLLTQHRQYLRKRNYPPIKLATLWDLRGIGPFMGRMSWRLFIPIKLHGETVSWTTRSLDDNNHGGRYVSAKPEQEKYSHKELLFGEDYVRNAVFICEGPFDVFRIGPGAVCTFGTAYGRSQLLRLSKYPLRIVVFDAEKDGQKAAERICSELEGFDGTTYNVVLNSKDPGSASQKEIKKLREKFAYV